MFWWDFNGEKPYIPPKSDHYPLNPIPKNDISRAGSAPPDALRNRGSSGPFPQGLPRPPDHPRQIRKNNWRLDFGGSDST